MSSVFVFLLSHLCKHAANQKRGNDAEKAWRLWRANLFARPNRQGFSDVEQGARLSIRTAAPVIRAATGAAITAPE